MWHRILLFLGLRDQFDWAPPGLGPEVNHPYEKHVALKCCVHCGGGWRHPIHREPFDARRFDEIMAARACVNPEANSQPDSYCASSRLDAGYISAAGPLSFTRLPAPGVKPSGTVRQFREKRG